MIPNKLANGEWDIQTSLEDEIAALKAEIAQLRERNAFLAAESGPRIRYGSFQEDLG